MFPIKVRQQTERAGIRPTLFVRFAQGIALEQVINQDPCEIGEDYTYEQGYSLIDLLLNHVISITIPSPPRWEDFKNRSYYYTMKQLRVNLTL